MSKEQYTRANVGVNDMLKKILFKVYYSGVTSIQTWVESFKKTELCKNNFKRYRTGYNNSAEFGQQELNQIDEKGYLPIKNYEKEPLHQFVGHLIDHDDTVYFDITPSYCALEVSCINYQGAAAYLDFIYNYITSFLASDSFIKIQKVGLRKMDSKEYDENVQIHEDFESSLFFGEQIYSSGKIERNYVDEINNQEDRIKTRIMRKSREITTAEEEKQKVQVIFDVDSSWFISTEGDFRAETLRTQLEKMNEFQFEIFKNAMTESFLKSHYHE